MAAPSHKPGRPGGPRGIPNKVKLVNPDEVIEAAATRIISGGELSAKALNQTMPSFEDTKRLQRVLGTSIEDFNQKLANKLAMLSDKIANRIEEKIDEDQFKPGELGFIFSVTEDKRRALDARSQLGSAQVNIQVNNYGDKTREEIMADLQIPGAPAMELPEPKDPEIKPEDVI